jgi:Uma2 family endonuclease
MMKPARRPARYDDILQAPEGKVAEIIDGELIVSSRPAWPHAFAASAMGADLIGGFQRPPGDAPPREGWWFVAEPELCCGNDVLVPDQAGWRRTNTADRPTTAAFTDRPDWVCEIVSPSTGKIDRTRKMRIYAREGVGHLWLVEPTLRTVEVYRLKGGEWVVATVCGGDGPARMEPFDAIELDVSRWWIDGA